MYVIINVLFTLLLRSDEAIALLNEVASDDDYDELAAWGAPDLKQYDLHSHSQCRTSPSVYLICVLTKCIVTYYVQCKKETTLSVY